METPSPAKQHAARPPRTTDSPVMLPPPIASTPRDEPLVHRTAFFNTQHERTNSGEFTRGHGHRLSSTSSTGGPVFAVIGGPRAVGPFGRPPLRCVRINDHPYSGLGGDNNNTGLIDASDHLDASDDTLDTCPRHRGCAGADKAWRSPSPASEGDESDQGRPGGSPISKPSRFTDVASVAESSLNSDKTHEFTIEEMYGTHELSVCDKVDRRLPFAAQVAILMFIPIAFLVAFSGIAMIDAAVSRQYLGSHEKFLRSMGDLQHQLMLERGISSQLLATQDPPQFATALGEARSKVTKYFDVVADEANASNDWLIHAGLRPRLRQMMREQFVLRANVDTLSIAASRVREQMTNFTLLLNEGRNAMIRSGKVPRPKRLIELRTAWHEANYLGICRAVGAHILAVRNATHVDWRLLIELESARTQYYFHRAEYAELVQDDYVGEERPSHITDARHAAEIALAGLRANPLTFNSTVISWFALFTAAVDGQLNFVDLIDDAIRMERANIITEAIKLVVAVAASIACGALIILAQVRMARRINHALLCSRRTQKAVLAFVPKQFLRMAGYTSILEVSPGDRTEIAATMLFSDIRAFTSIAERMANDDLFEWLQNYFARMTAIVEANHGFIDKFIGDAVFAVFHESNRAVQCGVDMQASTQQLNAAIVGQGGEYLVTIGVGVHHALVCVGFLGDARRLTCTMIASEVNIASRLEGLTKMYGAAVLVSGDAFDLLPQPDAFTSRQLGSAMVKGASKPLRIVEVFQTDELALKIHNNTTKAQFEKAVSLQADGHLDEAEHAYTALQSVANEAGVVDKAVVLKVSIGARDGVDHFDEK